MATVDAARALRWEHEIGSLEVGKAADVVIVDADNTRLTPAYHPVGTLVRYAVGTDVETVLVAGRVVVDDGSVLAIDEPSLLDEAEQLGDKLGQVLGPRRYHLLPVEPARSAAPCLSSEVSARVSAASGSRVRGRSEIGCATLAPRWPQTFAGRAEGGAEKAARPVRELNWPVDAGDRLEGASRLSPRRSSRPSSGWC